eukprot:g14355.t1
MNLLPNRNTVDDFARLQTEQLISATTTDPIGRTRVPINILNNRVQESDIVSSMSTNMHIDANPRPLQRQRRQLTLATATEVILQSVYNERNLHEFARILGERQLPRFIDLLETCDNTGDLLEEMEIDASQHINDASNVICDHLSQRQNRRQLRHELQSRGGEGECRMLCRRLQQHLSQLQQHLPQQQSRRSDQYPTYSKFYVPLLFAAAGQSDAKSLLEAPFNDVKFSTPDFDWDFERLLQGIWQYLESNLHRSAFSGFRRQNRSGEELVKAVLRHLDLDTTSGSNYIGNDIQDLFINEATFVGMHRYLLFAEGTSSGSTRDRTRSIAYRMCQILDAATLRQSVNVRSRYLPIGCDVNVIDQILNQLYGMEGSEFHGYGFGEWKDAEQYGKLTLIAGRTQLGKTQATLMMSWKLFFCASVPTLYFARSSAEAYIEMKNAIKDFNDKIDHVLDGFDVEQRCWHLYHLHYAEGSYDRRTTNNPSDGILSDKKALFYVRILTAINIRRAIALYAKKVARQFGAHSSYRGYINCAVVIDECQNTAQTRRLDVRKLESAIHSNVFPELHQAVEEGVRHTYGNLATEQYEQYIVDATEMCRHRLGRRHRGLTLMNSFRHVVLISATHATTNMLIHSRAIGKTKIQVQDNHHDYWGFTNRIKLYFITPTTTANALVRRGDLIEQKNGDETLASGILATFRSTSENTTILEVYLSQGTFQAGRCLWFADVEQEYVVTEVDEGVRIVNVQEENIDENFSEPFSQPYVTTTVQDVLQRDGFDHVLAYGCYGRNAVINDFVDSIRQRHSNKPVICLCAYASSDGRGARITGNRAANDILNAIGTADAQLHCYPGGRRERGQYWGQIIDTDDGQRRLVRGAGQLLQMTEDGFIDIYLPKNRQYRIRTQLDLVKKATELQGIENIYQSELKIFTVGGNLLREGVTVKTRDHHFPITCMIVAGAQRTLSKQDMVRVTQACGRICGRRIQDENIRDPQLVCPKDIAMQLRDYMLIDHGIFLSINRSPDRAPGQTLAIDGADQVVDTTIRDRSPLVVSARILPRAEQLRFIGGTRRNRIYKRYMVARNGNVRIPYEKVRWDKVEQYARSMSSTNLNEQDRVLRFGFNSNGRPYIRRLFHNVVTYNPDTNRDGRNLDQMNRVFWPPTLFGIRHPSNELKVEQERFLDTIINFDECFGTVFEEEEYEESWRTRTNNNVHTEPLRPIAQEEMVDQTT